MFWPPDFFGEAPNFWTCIIKFSEFPIMRRSLTAIGRGTSENAWRNKTRSSARLTNQRVSYAFTSSPLSFHECHILPTSNFQHSYSCILQASVNSMCENCESKTVNTVHWFDTSCSVIPVNNSITLISPVQAGLHFYRATLCVARSLW